MAAVAGGGDAAEVVRVGGEDGFGGFPDGGGVFVEGEFVEDEVAGEAAGGAWVGGEDFDAAGLAVGADADFHAHVLEFEAAGEVLGFELGAVEVADFGAFGEEFGAVFAGVGEDGDEAAGAGEEAVDGPGGEGEGFADLAGPMKDEDAGGAVHEDGDLIGTESDADAGMGLRVRVGGWWVGLLAESNDAAGANLVIGYRGTGTQDLVDRCAGKFETAERGQFCGGYGDHGWVVYLKESIAEYGGTTRNRLNIRILVTTAKC